jgi:hypothetical protein
MANRDGDTRPTALTFFARSLVYNQTTAASVVCFSKANLSDRMINHVKDFTKVDDL